jgi:hypothetical protein
MLPPLAAGGDGSELRERSEIDPSSVDLFHPYDGYTTTALSHLEANGFRGFGEGGDLLADSWDTEDKSSG